MNRHCGLRSNSVDEVKDLATYLQGMADATDNQRICLAAEWLDKLSRQVCGQGYIGCHGGRECSSDHK